MSFAKNRELNLNKKLLWGKRESGGKHQTVIIHIKRYSN
jgi:hypothetical protein